MKLELKDLKGVKGALAALGVVALLLGYHQWRRSSLEDAARLEAVRFLRAELPARYARETMGSPDPAAIDALGRVVVTDIDLPLFAGERVWVNVQARDGIGNVYLVKLRLRRALGSWTRVSANIQPGY